MFCIETLIRKRIGLQIEHKCFICNLEKAFLNDAVSIKFLMQKKSSFQLTEFKLLKAFCKFQSASDSFFFFQISQQFSPNSVLLQHDPFVKPIKCTDVHVVQKSDWPADLILVPRATQRRRDICPRPCQGRRRSFKAA